MPGNTQQLVTDIQQLSKVLQELTTQSILSSDNLEILNLVLDRLNATGVARFSAIDTSFKEIAETLKLVAEEAGFTETEVDKLIRSFDKLRVGPEGSDKLGRLRLSDDIKKIAPTFEQLEKRLQRAGNKAQIASSDFATVRDRLRELSQLPGFEGKAVRSISALGRSLGFTKAQTQALISVTRRWRTQVQTANKAVQALATSTKSLGLKGLISTLGTPGAGGGDEQNIGRTIASQRELYTKILPGGARALDTVEKSLNKAGLTLNELHDVTEDSSRGIVRWSASLETQEGITKRAVITTNRLGQELKSTQRHLRTFTGAIIRDIVEVTKWTVAIAIVYAPLRRVTQLMEEAVQIEAKLADVQIALVHSSSNLSLVWKESASIARELGVSAEGVVDGYVLAARAVANIENPAERAAATTAILKDSMLLAKLAGIDQALAMDTLVGALRQLGRPLTEGIQLLDKWVAVSKVANVSIATLAESFAITSTAAANVGLDIDHLNGVIAAVAEVTTLSATESGNAVRAFISGFQRDNSQRELAKFGIAVRNVNGELRFFTEVIGDIIERKNLGLISDSELAKIAEVIGGGARRGPQVTALLENYNRVQELAAVSANASGDAAEALEIKMDTLQTSVQNLNNAFTEFAKVLGSEGGFLDAAKNSTEIFTSFIDTISKIVAVLGKATPAILAMGAALLVLSRSARLATLGDMGILGALTQGTIGPNQGRFAGVRRGLAGRAQQAGLGRGTTFGQLGGRFFGAGGGAVGGGIIGAGMAAMGGNLQKGNLDRAGAQIGLAAAGAIAGGPVGALVGATIADVFFSSIVDKEHDLKGVFDRIFTEQFRPEGAEETPEEIDRRIKDAEEEITRLIGKNLGIESRLLGQIALAEAEAIIPGEAQGDALLVLAEVAAGRETGPQADIISTFFGLGDLTPEDKAKIADLIDQIKAESFAGFEAAAIEDETSAFGLRLLGVSEDLGPQAAKIISDQRNFLLQQVSRGEIGVRALTEFLNIGDFEQVASTVYTGMTALGTATAEYSVIAETLIKATEQERGIFVALTEDIAELEVEYDALSGFVEDYVIRVERARIATELFALQLQLIEFEEATRSGQAFKEFDVPDVVEVTGGATAEQIRQAVADTRRLQEEQVQALSPDATLQEKIRQDWEDIMVQIGETIDASYTQVFTDLDTGIFADVLREAGLEAQEVQLGILTPDLPSEQAGQLRGNIQFFQDIIKQLRPLEIEEIGIIFSDYVTDILHADNLAVQLALATLIDVNEQQLEGIFNIPEGVTAQIPFTGRLFFSDQPIPEAGLGNILEALGPALDELPQAVEEVGSTAHSDAQSQIDLLNQMLATGITSDALAAAIENAIRERGGEPVERGPEEVETVLAEIEQALVELTGRGVDTGRIPLTRGQRESDTPTLPEDFIFDATSLDTLIRSMQEWVNQPVPSFGEMFQGLGDWFKENFSVQTAEAAGPMGDLLTQNPALSNLMGPNALSTQDVLGALPSSIPVTIHTRIINPVTVVVDGLIVQKALEERHYEDLHSATRRTGAVGYIME